MQVDHHRSEKWHEVNRGYSRKASSSLYQPVQSAIWREPYANVLDQAVPNPTFLSLPADQVRHVQIGKSSKILFCQGVNITEHFLDWHSMSPQQSLSHKHQRFSHLIPE